ncbi:MAG: YqeG family HAD IIIA-type phosphatase [Clostridiaceae bacterium]|jgi:uncharacterized protein|nr:YqeG family HAD IIIA-type phosphatase [Clostridiaceae bacterium]
MFLKPDYNLKRIFDIDLDELKAQGVKAILFDLDSTLMASKTAEYSPEIKEWLKGVRKDFFIAVVSNNKNPEYIEKVTSVTDFPVLFKANKPSPKRAKEFLKNQGYDCKSTVLVGDRPLTDIWCGKLMGCKTILVDSITADTENLPTRFVRHLERICVRK